MHEPNPSFACPFQIFYSYQKKTENKRKKWSNWSETFKIGAIENYFDGMDKTELNWN